ncbi:MAG: site-specific integrase [Eubacterium sp.]|jgi:integrase|nr:site-specific integrase [Eubacterium sp.]
MVTGSLKKRYDKWYVIICFNISGKQKQKWINTGLPVSANKKNAEKVLKEKIAEYSSKETEESADKDTLLFCDFIADWLEIHRMNIESITYSGYKRLLKQVYAYFKKLRVTLENLTPLHIQKYYAAKLKEVSANTVLKHHAFIRSALAYAKKMNLVRENAADLAEKPKKQKFIGDFYNKEEIGRLLEVIKDSPIETPVMLAIYFGLRRSEIIGVKWSAIDFVSKTLTINHKVVPLNENGKCRLELSDVLKNKSSYRTMPLNGHLCEHLSALKKKQEDNKIFAGKGYNRTYEDYVCVNDLGVLLNPEYITKKFRELLRGNGLRVIRLHDLRHSCASLLLHLRYSMKEIQEWLGHRDISTTMNIYAHIEDSDKKNIIKSIENALSKT